MKMPHLLKGLANGRLVGFDDAVPSEQRLKR
jgi:hypothetical protein